jgi:hypothetical protein
MTPVFYDDKEFEFRNNIEVLFKKNRYFLIFNNAK